jgi:hypothetical protein
MKTIVIGDLHGNDIWRSIVKKHKDADKIIFVGDYFDTHEKISATLQLHNFKKLIKLKEKNMSRVVLLPGNHDYQYMPGVRETYSGYQPLHRIDFQEELVNAINKMLLNLLYVENNIIFSHAGLTKTFCNRVLKTAEPTVAQIESLNELFFHKPIEFSFRIGGNLSRHGDDVCQGPLWVRPESLLTDKLDKFGQIVGHTIMRRIVCSNEDNPELGLTFVDTLNSAKEYLEINDNQFNIIKHEDTT